MSAAPPEAPLAEQAAAAARERGVAAGARTLFAAVRARLRHGELGALPVIIGLIVIWAYFDIQDPHFLTARNLSNLVLQIAVTGTIAIGMVLVLLLGEIDLSVGSVAGVAAAALGVLVVSHGWAWWLGILVMLAAGAVMGAFQGVWVAIVGVPSFVVTLAGLLGWQGVQLHILGDTGTVNVFESHISAVATSFLSIALGWILTAVGVGLYAAMQLVGQARRRRAGLAASPILLVIAKIVLVAAIFVVAVAVLDQAGGVPTAGLILIALVVAFVLLTSRTRFGRYIYAVGGNAEAARRAGIKVTRIRIYVFTLASTFAAIGALIQVSRGAAASTQTGGGTLLLEVIAAAVIGGTSLFGGRGNVWAALLGALVIGSVSNGLDLLGQAADVKLIVEGAILLLAVTIDAISRRGRTAGVR